MIFKVASFLSTHLRKKHISKRRCAFFNEIRPPLAPAAIGLTLIIPMGEYPGGPSTPYLS